MDRVTQKQIENFNDQEDDASEYVKDKQTYIAVQATKVTNNQRFVFTEALDSDFLHRSWLVSRLEERLNDMLRSEMPSFNIAPTILGPPLSESAGPVAVRTILPLFQFANFMLRLTKPFCMAGTLFD